MVRHVLVVDDDRPITDLLRRTLAHAGFTVSIAASGSEGLQAVVDRPPDLIILDVMMPGMDGFEVCRRLREGGTTVPILMLTARDAVPDRVAGLRGGADDYLAKPFALDELLARVEVLLRRGPVEPQTVLRFEDITLNTATHEGNRGTHEIVLSTTEFAWLELFLRRPRQVLPRSVIMERVWDYDFGNGSNVLDVYIGYLRAKLEAGGGSRVIQTVRGVGYALRD